jgi:hypothetical protein
LVTRVLEKLKIVGSGQTGSAEDALLVDKVIDPVMSSLATRQIFSWGDEDELPDEAFEHLADCVAFACAGDFGKSYGDRSARLGFEHDLRQLDLYALSGQHQVAEYY